MSLQSACFECSSEMLDAKLELNMLKEKAEKLHLNQKHRKNEPKGDNASFELQVKQHVKRGLSSEFQLIGGILQI